MSANGQKRTSRWRPDCWRRLLFDASRLEDIPGVEDVLEQTTGKLLRTLFVKTFLEPLAMRDSVPDPDVADDAKTSAVLGEANRKRYRQVLTKFAQPHTYYGDGEVVHTTYPPGDLWVPKIRPWTMTFVREGERVMRIGWS